MGAKKRAEKRIKCPFSSTQEPTKRRGMPRPETTPTSSRRRGVENRGERQLDLTPTTPYFAHHFTPETAAIDTLNRMRDVKQYTYFEPENLEEAEECMIETAIAVVEQPLLMFRNGSIGDEEMRYESKLLPHSTPGKHLRQ